MAQKHDLRYLQVALVLVGLIFLVGIYSLMIIWPSGWTWHTRTRVQVTAGILWPEPMTSSVLAGGPIPCGRGRYPQASDSTIRAPG